MKLIASEKLDGQNDCFKKEGVFARSHTAPSAHLWDKPMWDRWELIKNDLKGLEIFGENMYGIHSIGYKKDDSLREWLKSFLGMNWEEYTDTHGMLGGYDPENDKPACEGFVIRNVESFKTNDGIIKTQSNEFNNIFKLVREKHVKTDEHWTKTWKPATLINSEKYKWYGYENNYKTK